MIAPRDTLERDAKTAAQKAPALLSWEQLLSVPYSEIPALVGELERAKATLLARLVRPDNREPEEDPLLTVEQVAEMLQVERRWVYRHKDKLGAMALSRKQLRFPSSRVDAYLRRRKAASSGRRK